MSRVLLHTLVFSPDAVSTSYLMTDLATQLQSMGHDVTVLTTTPHYNLDQKSLMRQPLKQHWMGVLFQSEVHGVHVWHIKIPMKGQRVYSRVLDYLYFHFMALVVGVSLVGSCDIVITPSPPLTIGIVGWLLGVIKRAPCVYNVQEIYPDYAINQGLIRNRMVIAFLKTLERFVYRRSTAVVTISKWFSDIIRGRGIKNGKLSVIPNSVDIELYRPLPRDNPFAEKHGLNDKFVVLYGGNIGLSQDWDSFLYAAKTLSHLPIVFAVVGDGVLGKWLKDEVITQKLSNVLFLGYQSREFMPQINASSDICTIPMKATSTTDTFPSKIYTIMASGKSVVVQADADSELHWLIDHVRCGRVVQPGVPELYCDAIHKAFLERDLLRVEGDRGREYVRTEYSKEVVAQKYHRLIHTLTHATLAESPQS